jgi:hypothetical protein
MVIIVILKAVKMTRLSIKKANLGPKEETSLYLEEIVLRA